MTTDNFPRIAAGVVEIDTMLGGWDKMTAGYLIEGPRPVLVETGSQSSISTLLGALDRLGVGPGGLAGVAVTHIHLDHAGGVGDVARAFPNATVYVHEKGARHLADPVRLIDSAARVYGPLLDSLYGRLDATPTERIHVLVDGEEIDVGEGRTLRAIDSPGHAKHHLGLLDSASGLLFAGDAVGVRLPDGGVLRPATPPPDFDLGQALRSLRRFAEHQPAGIALAHYGLVPIDPYELLEEAEGTLRVWAEEAERAWRAGEDIAAALEGRFGGRPGGAEQAGAGGGSGSDKAGAAGRSSGAGGRGGEAGGVEHAESGGAGGKTAEETITEKLETLNGFHSNAAGLRRWLEKRAAAEADGSGTTES